MSDIFTRKIIALRKTVWGVSDVKAFLGCGNDKAYREIAKCRLRFGGSVGNTHQVKRDQFLEMYSTDYEREMDAVYAEIKAFEKHK